MLFLGSQVGTLLLRNVGHQDLIIIFCFIAKA